MIVFSNPAAFLFFLFFPALYVLRKLGIFSPIAFPLTIADWKGKSFVWKGKVTKAGGFFCRLLSAVGFSLLVFALADPVIRHQEKIYTSKGADILFVLDNSPSMASKDIADKQAVNSVISRIEAAKENIRRLVENEKGASFGLVVMANQSAALVSPTMDHEFFLSRLRDIRVGSLGEGTAIGNGLSTAVYHLSSSKAPKKCIVLITDGENNAGSIHPETAAALAKENNITLYTFGIGTNGTVPIEYVEPESGKVRSGVYDSKFDSEPLKHLASLSDGRYFGIESVQNLGDALAEVNRKESTLQSFYLRTVENHCYTRLLMLAAMFFAAGWIIRRIFLMEIL